MGTVHSLQSSIRERPVDGHAAGIGRCEIIIFPGVRIERHDPAIVQGTDGATGSFEFDGLAGGQPPPPRSP
jgi:hypothetical protein